MIEAQAQAESAFAFAAERFGPAPISAARADAGMRAALLWLADNVSDEMVRVSLGWEVEVWEIAKNVWYKTIEAEREKLSAALRQAAGGDK